MFCLIALIIWWSSPPFPKWLSRPRVSCSGTQVKWAHPSPGFHTPYPFHPGHLPRSAQPKGFRTKLFMKRRGGGVGRERRAGQGYNPFCLGCQGERQRGLYPYRIHIKILRTNKKEKNSSKSTLIHDNTSDCHKGGIQGIILQRVLT